MDKRKIIYKIFNDFILKYPDHDRISTSFKSRFKFISMVDNSNFIIYSQIRDKLVHQYMKYNDLFYTKTGKEKFNENCKSMKELYQSLLTTEIQKIFVNVKKEQEYINFITSKQCFLSRLKMKLNDTNEKKVKVVRDTINMIKEVIMKFDNIWKGEVEKMFDDMNIKSITKLEDMNDLYKILSWVNRSMYVIKTMKSEELINSDSFKNVNIVAIKQQAKSLASEKSSFNYIELYKTIQQSPSDGFLRNHPKVISELKRLRFDVIVNDVAGINNTYNRNITKQKMDYGLPNENINSSQEKLDKSDVHHMMKMYKQPNANGKYIIVKYFDTENVNILALNNYTETIFDINESNKIIFNELIKTM